MELLEQQMVIGQTAVGELWTDWGMYEGFSYWLSQTNPDVKLGDNKQTRKWHPLTLAILKALKTSVFSNI